MTVEKAWMDCSASELCEEALAEGGALECVEGQNVNANQDDSSMYACKTYKRVSKEWQYAKAKRKSPIPIVFFMAFLVGSFMTFSYTYFVRHSKANQASTKTALMEAELSAGGPSSPDSTYREAP